MNGCKNPQPEGAEQSTKKRACAMASRRPPQHTVCGHFLIGKERERERKETAWYFTPKSIFSRSTERATKKSSDFSSLPAEPCDDRDGRRRRRGTESPPLPARYVCASAPSPFPPFQQQLDPPRPVDAVAVAVGGQSALAAAVSPADGFAAFA
jgi:hypothetical protein